MAEQLVEIRLVVKDSFQVPRELDDPNTVEQVLTMGMAALADDLITRSQLKKELKKLRQEHEEEVSELRTEVESLQVQLKEEKDRTIKLFETIVQEKNNMVHALQDSQNENNRLLADLSERLNVFTDVPNPSFEDSTELLQNVFPTALVDKASGNFFFEFDDFKLWVCLSSSDTFNTDEKFHEAVVGARSSGAKGTLFLAINSNCRLIHGASNVFFEYVDDIPVIYLGRGGCGNRIVLQTCTMLLRNLSRTFSAIDSPQQDIQVESHRQRKSRLPKKPLDEVVLWMQKNVDYEMSADDLCKRMCISTRNVNDLGGICKLKEAAYGIKDTRRGRGKGHSHSSPTTIIMNGEVEGSPS